MGALVIKKMAFDSGVQGLWLPGINATVLQNRDGAAEVVWVSSRGLGLWFRSISHSAYGV